MGAFVFSSCCPNSQHNTHPHTQPQSFENITSIDHSLQLLRRFQAVLQRESLKSDLDSKLTVIFQNYGMELEQVRACMCMRACVLCWYDKQSFFFFQTLMHLHTNATTAGPAALREADA